MIGGSPIDALSKPTIDQMLSKVPPPVPAARAIEAGEGTGSGQGRSPNGMGTGNTIHIHQTINGAGDSPEVLAGKIQRRISETRNYRSHDMEPELT